jgi:uncharacterized membrane protein (DUF373 family)
MTEPQDEQRMHPMLKYTEQFKRIIAGVLLVLMGVLILIATAELVLGMVSAVVPSHFFSAANAILTEDQLLRAFGIFLTVLIALELLETVEVYFREHAVHIEIVLLVAMIALARKFILLDPNEYNGVTLIALASIVLALGVAYYLVRRAGPAE